MCRALKDGLQGPCPVLSSTGPKMMKGGLYMDMPGIHARYARSLAAWVAHTLHACVTQEHIPPPSLLWCPLSSVPGSGVNAASRQGLM